MYRVLIVEDMPEEANTMRGHLQRYAQETGLQFHVEHLASALDFVSSNHPADLILMDIDMPGINGLEAAGILRMRDHTTPLIFVTNLAQYAVRGYQVDALDFMVKPVAYPTFAQSMDRAVRVMARNARRTIALPTETGMRVVDVAEITYIDMLKHDVVYHLRDGSGPLRERGSLKATEERLADAEFLRISAGCLINMAQVTRIGQDSVTMADGSELYYSRSQRKHALETLANYVGRSI